MSNKLMLDYLNSKVYEFFRDSEVVKLISKIIFRYRGNPNGIASLDENAQVPIEQIPSIALERIFVYVNIADEQYPWTAAINGHLSITNVQTGDIVKMATTAGQNIMYIIKYAKVQADLEDSANYIEFSAGTSVNFSGSLSGDVTGTQTATVVSKVTNGTGIVRATSGTPSIAISGIDYIAGNQGAQYNTPYFSALGTLSASSTTLTDGMAVGIGGISYADFPNSGGTKVKLVVGDTTNLSPRGIMSWQSSTDTNGARFHLRKSRGTFASPTVISNSDVLGRIVSSGYTASSTYLETANIEFKAAASGTIDATHLPSQISFYTTDTGGNYNEALQLSSERAVKFPYNAGVITPAGVASYITMWAGDLGTLNFRKGTGAKIGISLPTAADQTFTFPNVGTDSTIAVLEKVQTFTASQTMPSAIFSGTAGSGFIQLANQSSTPTGLSNYTTLYSDTNGKLSWRNGTSALTRTLDATGIDIATTWNLPYKTATGTISIAALEVAQTYTAAQTFNAGITVVGTSTFPSGASISSGGSVTSGGNINMPSSGTFAFIGRIVMSTVANGNLTLMNGSSSDFGYLQFGGTTNSFPALTRSGTTLQAKLADGSSFCDFTALNISTSTGNLTSNNNIIANGSLSTNSTVNTGNFYVTSSTAAVSQVFGTNPGWCIGGVSTFIRTGIGAGANNSSSVTTSQNYANTVIGSAPITAAGTHTMFANLAVKAIGTITGTPTTTASLYVDGASSGGTNNYALYVNSGTSYFGGSVTKTYAAKTVDYSIVTGDYVIDVTAASKTMTLPSAVGITGRVYKIKGTVATTLMTVSSQRIDGTDYSSVGLTIALNNCVTVMSTGTNWIII